MMSFLDTPYFGIILSILFFELGLYIYKKSKISFLNPLLISITGIIIFLSTFNINTAYYHKGGDLILFFLGPATVILAVPLYKQRALLRVHLLPILIGAAVGCITAITSVIVLAKVFNIQEVLTTSLVPKSVTTPIGVEISTALGGIPGITIGGILVAGIFGAVIAPAVCKIFRIKDKVAVGIAIGTASHAAGTTRAIEMGETEGAMSGLAIGIAGLITVLIAPILLSILL